jgi:hypothetical protein
MWNDFVGAVNRTKISECKLVQLSVNAQIVYLDSMSHMDGFATYQDLTCPCVPSVNLNPKGTPVLC